MKYFEDIEIEKIDRAGPMELTESGIIDFAKQWDPLPFHTDAQAAKESVFGGLAASGCHMICIAWCLLHDIERPAVIAALAWIPTLGKRLNTTTA
jgi:acyl dehydratase